MVASTQALAAWAQARYPAIVSVSHWIVLNCGAQRLVERRGGGGAALLLLPSSKHLPCRHVPPRPSGGALSCGITVYDTVGTTEVRDCCCCCCELNNPLSRASLGATGHTHFGSAEILSSRSQRKQLYQRKWYRECSTLLRPLRHSLACTTGNTRDIPRLTQWHNAAAAADASRPLLGTPLPGTRISRHSARNAPSLRFLNMPSIASLPLDEAKPDSKVDQSMT